MSFIYPTSAQENTAYQLAQLGMAYIEIDPDGLVLATNDVLLTALGREVADVVGQPFAECLAGAVNADEWPAWVAAVQAGQTLGEPPFANKLGGPVPIWVSWQWRPLPDGRGLWAAGKPHDAAPATPQLNPDPAFLREFFDDSHDLIVKLDLANQILAINRAGLEKLGYEEGELLGRPLLDVVHPYYRAKLLYQLRRLYEGQALNKLETVLLTSSGRPVHLIGSVSSGQGAGQPQYARAVLHDITDRIKAERLQKVYYSIANLAISAHDLPALYSAIHRELSKVIETHNIFIALCDEERTELRFVYYVDQYAYFEQGGERPFSMGISEYVIEQGRPMFFTQAELIELMHTGNLTAFGRMPAVLLASPLRLGERTIGVLTVQEYERADLYTPADLDILHFISGQVALAIDRKGREEHLALQNARLNSIFESGPHLLWSVNLSGQLVSFNRNYAAFFLRRNGMLPIQGLDLLENDLLQDDELTRRAFYTHYDAAGKGRSQKFEVVVRDGQERQVWLSINLDPIYLPDGSFEEIAAQAQDITSSKNSQLELAAQEEKFRSIFESFQDIYYRTDREGHFTILSPSVEQVLGYDPGRGIGELVDSVYFDENQYDTVLEALAGSNELRNFDVRMRHADGHPVNMLVNVRRTATGTEGIARDITEIRRIQDDLRLAKEEAEAASAAKTQFLANMSHELRTPMNGIIGMIDLLSQTQLTGEQTDYVDTLRTSSDALLTILNDILDLSKIQAGKMRLHVAPLALQPLLNRLHSLFAYRAGQKSLRFTCHLAHNVPAIIASDETRLLQILSNLAANAIKFTSQGTVSIVISLVSREGSECVLRFGVQDSGIGISPDDAARLFTSFTQLDTTPSKAYGGTGLGLAISKELAELLGGTIGVVSNVGEGSAFWFTIRCQVPEASVLPVLAAAPESGLAHYGASVLLVDDNAINQKVAARLLTKLGCHVEVASDGYEAIARATAAHAPYQLIFMDIQMPGLDGIRATRAIRSKLGAASPPIVAMTAYSMPEDAARFVQAGLDDYLAKPVKQQQLAQVLARWLTPALPIDLEVNEPTEVLPSAGPDAEVLAQLRQLGGPEFAHELYGEFAREGATVLEQANASFAAGDVTALQSQVHQLKGTAATLGLLGLSGQAKTMEHHLRAYETLPPLADLERLHLYFNQFLLLYPELNNTPSQHEN